MGIEELKKQLNEFEQEITKNKLAIAELFLDIYHSKPSENPTFDEFSEHMKNMAKIPPLIQELEKKETRYNAMLDSMILIENSLAE